MGSTLVAVNADNIKPALNNVRKQQAFGWWEQWTPGADLQPQAIQTNGGAATAEAQPNATLRLQVDVPGTQALGRILAILEGYKGGNVEIAARIAFVGSPPIQGGETVTVALIALPAALGDGGFPTPAFPADVIGTAIIFDDTTDDAIQEVKAVFRPDAEDGDQIAIGIVAAKTAGNTSVEVDVAGLHVGQILQQSVPRGGNS